MALIEGRSESEVRPEKRRRRRVPASVCRRCGIRVRWYQVRCPYCDRLPKAFWIAVAAISAGAAAIVAVDLILR